MRHLVLVAALTLVALVGPDVAGVVLAAAVADLSATVPKVLLVTLALYAGVLLIWRIRASRSRG